MKNLCKLLSILSMFLFISGCWKTTVNGNHTGQVTSLENNGLFWKTTTIYFKTDIRSSQEDKYCLDKTQKNYSELLERLKQASDNHRFITIIYHDEMFVGWWRCSSESGIIDNVINEDK